MDYDDNDAPGNNFQLAGEGGSKSSSVLRPYAFPRFDFDDSLPGQLRFDSLVETEVFLGIQSQEDNQWIEDYSRGNNVIEFSSSATDSCSISRRNNVWSEATSSESVEMLLKSVGQDQIGHSDSVIDNSSTSFNELDRLAKQMEANRDKESRNSGYSKISEDTLPSNELLGNLKDHVEGDLADIQGTSLPEVSFTSAHGDPSLSVPSVSEDKFVAPGTEETLHMEGECADRSGKEAGCFNDKSMYCMTGTESCNASEAQDIDTGLGNLDSSESPKEIRDTSQEDACVLTDGVGDGMEEDQHISNEAKEGTQVSEKHALEDASLSVGSPVCHASSVDKSNADESISNLCMGSGGISLGESEHQLLKGSVKDALCTAPSQQEDGEVNVLLTSGSIIDANRDSELIAVGKEQLDCKISSLNEGLHSPIESTRISVKHVADGLGEKLGKNIYKEDSEVTRSISETSFDARGLIEHSTDKIDEAKSVKDFSDALTTDAKEPKFQSGCEEVPVINEDVPVTKEVHIEVSGDTMNLSSTASVAGTEQQVMGSSYMVETITHGDKILDQIQSEPAAEMGSETDSLPGEKKSEVAEANKEDTVAEPSATVVSKSDGKELFAPKITTDYSLVKEKSTPAILEIEFETAVSGLSEDHPEGSRSLLDQHEDTLNKIESGSARIAKNQEDESVVHEVEKESLLPTDSMEVVCGSPTIINSGDPVQDEEFKQQKVRASAVADELAETQQCASEGPKATSEDDNSFTFKVNSLPEAAEREKDASWTPFSIAEKYKSPKVVGAPRTPNMEKIDARLPPENPGPSPVASISGVEKIHAKVMHETCGRSRKVSEGDLAGGSSKSASGRKGRRASGKGIDKESSLKLNSQKDTTPTKSARKGDKSPSVPLSSSGSTLPAFNPSGSPPTPAFQQPFTDLQQVQLRAQIFVYGSLIQGTAPEEACMVSAFGSSDGGRKVWESAWRAAVERVHSRKSHSGVETPLHSAAVRSPDLVGKQGSQQSKVLPAPATRVGSKGLTAPMLNPMIPPSSPLWNVSTPHDSSQSGGIQRSTVVEYQPAISPLHPFQTPVRSFIGHTAWPSQPPFPASPWAAQTSVSNAGARFSTIPITEPAKLIPVKDSSSPPLSGVQNVSTSPIVLTGDPNLVFAGVSSSLPGQTLGVSSSQLPSTDLKPRRRKKSQASADVGQSPPTSQTESVLASPMAIPTSSLVAVTASASQIPNSFSTVSPMCSISTGTSSPQPKVGDLNAGKGDTGADDTLRNVSEAKLQAEVAASLAAVALNHSQSVWNDLAKQKDSGEISEVEAKLSSAAVAIAAAASVAKAAAAAARVASNAALQAKLMAEEALIGSRTLSQGGILSSDVLSMRNIDDSCGHPGSIILAAREAAKRRIEAATAAAKQAENLDAMVRAAELAAEAVSQAGHIVAMGEPLPLKELIDAGPAGYWKVRQTSLELAVQSGDKINEQRDASVQGTEGGPSAGVKDACNDKKTSSREKLTDSCHVSIAAEDIPQSVNSAKNDQDVLKRHNDTNIDESSGMVHVPETNVGAELVPQEPEELDHGSSIIKGSLVEVYKQGDGLKPAWFSATVLDVEDGKAFVCYSSLLSDGSNNLKEWVVLDGLVDQAPRIRTAPATSSHSQGTRKRRRMATGDYAWIVGDRVDVQFQDSWWEGVVTEKNEKDESTLTVYFPARGETSAVRSWQLRPSRIWSDGKWVELPRVRAQDCSAEDDIPNEKRQKFGSPLIVSKGKDKLPETSETHVERPEGSKLLALSSKDKIFNVGKNTNSESKPAARRTARTGLQKDGSKVVFGVPKPGKKRKFMEVSKHYPANSNIPPDRSNKNEANDPAKFTKYLVPQSTGPRGWKSFSKVDSKEKHTAPRVASSHKPTTTARRTVPRREKTLKSQSAKHDENFTDSSADINDPELHDFNVSDRLRSIDQESTGPEEAKEGPLSSLFPSQLEKLSSSSARFERLYKGKLGPSGGKLTKIEEEVPNGKTGKAASEAAEPRRSNRRIQPTHRLLEGLQSSLIIPKMSSVSHDRNHRTQSRSTTGKGK